MRNIIFEISGGMGKSIMGTAVVRAIKKQYPEDNIIVVTEYPAVFVNNPRIYRVVRFGTPYFYDEYVKNKDVIFLCQEPYKTDSYLKESKHLTESWCEANNIVWDGNRPELYLTPLEIQKVKNSLNLSKPLMVIQPFGGFNQNIKYSWNRDIPFSQMQSLVDYYKKDYEIFHIGKENQLTLENAKKYTNSNIREIFALIGLSKKRIGIDSMMQHCAAAFNLNSLICWISNSPTVFGYSLHTNVVPKLTPNQVSLPDGFYTKYDFTGSRQYDFPYNSFDLFDLEQIITLL